MKIAHKLTIKIFSPSMVTLLLLWILAYNSRIGIAQSGMPVEIGYYEGVSGVYLESQFPWSDFKELNGYFLRVSRQGLRQESIKVRDALGVCRVFIDSTQGVMWITGFIRIQVDEPTMFVYYWVDPSGGSPLIKNESPHIGTV